MRCPRCSAGPGDGFFSIERPVRARFAFIKFTAILKIIYCPRCGLLKLSMAGIHAEGVT
ncbi:MAG: hypothetical protein J7M18_08830 [Candidatus Eremiobacteraeota bacterium]|nr:hypothetical protein [Candidatus Eremiobacteraeota bacterium]